ncbi:3-oxo-5-alpha-steroid 4-dehydrogenase [Saccharata proteae CBS 121410]|uniref:Polyprenal reductase n=1 Tax=Saccharata proteae CBS 121410 TaxID=1314787 RepID=A0A9P4M3E9_9PEZI|nr:3-oxo-5-alpha-steroid 4-dehydrogenase [Saccharata proteae CBS 121410]
MERANAVLPEVDIEPAQLLQAFFLTAALIVLTVYIIEPFRARFLAYGSRALPVQQADPPKPETRAGAVRLLDHLATYQVPHSWFTHFYVLSVACSLLWAQQYASNGPLFRAIADRTHDIDGPSQSLERVYAAWVLMLVQGLRRLYESIALSRPSTSRMWVTHWILGLLFYATMSVSVWVEGVPALLSSREAPNLFALRGSIYVLCIFIWASMNQHFAHAYLVGLRKYTLPSKGMFKKVVCAHYLFECIIYLALSLLAAPAGQVFNKTVLCALAFVAINLGVTADGTKAWYETKFGRDSVGERARMIPFVW